MNADNTTAQMTTSKAATLCGLRRPCLPAFFALCLRPFIATLTAASMTPAVAHTRQVTLSR
ncbi:hypothetical protein [Xanthomonas euvesicatoria]|uniref:hypothetical protein n=1 Tax=Xanthomonas euvesicatoria TaxID=456327 RepID=UPI0035569F70